MHVAPSAHAHFRMNTELVTGRPCFIAHAPGDAPSPEHLWIEERELKAGGLNQLDPVTVCS